MEKISSISTKLNRRIIQCFFFRNFEKLFTYLNFPLGFEYECMDEYEMCMCNVYKNDEDLSNNLYEKIGKWIYGEIHEIFKSSILNFKIIKLEIS